MLSSLALLQALALAVKCSLMWGYRSTDFEVHRNWMAITYNEPLSRWYYNEMSIWTLDSPPLFAYFEWCLSQIAVKIDPDIVKLSAEQIVNDNVIVFQRCSVIFSEFLLVWAALSCMEHFPWLREPKRSNLVYLLLIFNAGLIMVDHMHFQYNGMLLGILVSTFIVSFKENYVVMAWIFSCLVLFKHLFMTLAPVYALFLLRFYCIKESKLTNFDVYYRFMILVLVAFVTLVACFGPLLITGLGVASEDLFDIVRDRLVQILGRLFPFGRGLVHSYWAPNIWAIYYFFDRFVYAYVRYFPDSLWTSSQILQVENAPASTVSGLVGGVVPAIFKEVSAPFCMVLVLIFMTPALYQIMNAKITHKASDASNRTKLLIKCVVHASLTSFLFGYHVHEKAILVPLIAQTFLLGGSGVKGEDTGFRLAHELYFELAVSGVAGLLPLFTTEAESYRKLIIFAVYVWLCTRLGFSYPVGRWNRFMALTVIGAVCITEWVYPLASTQSSFATLAAFCSKYKFLPLMITSVTNAIFLSHAWLVSWRQLHAT